jgi:hypothetical protein
MTLVKMPKAWEIIKSFKDSCKSHGWRTSDNQDWVDVGGEYHIFFLARDVHDSSFKKIVKNNKCVVCEGLSYRVAEASCSAWLFSETPSEALVRTVSENPDLSSRVALYDLCPMLEGKDFCVKLNHTKSPVFKQFESFLKKKMNITFKPLPSFSNVEANVDDCRIAELP